MTIKLADLKNPVGSEIWEVSPVYRDRAIANTAVREPQCGLLNVFGERQIFIIMKTFLVKAVLPYPAPCLIWRI